MRTLKVAALCCALLLIPAALTASASPQAKQTALHQVQKIYLEEVGTSDEAARFRLLLEEKLTEKGFTVVGGPDQADAILSGALSVSQPGIYGGPSDVGVTVQLKSQAGQRLWGGNFAGRVFILNPVSSLRFKDIVEYRAKELAKRLRADWEKSARQAGVRGGD
jgi:hypothetical protein